TRPPRSEAPRCRRFPSAPQQACLLPGPSSIRGFCIRVPCLASRYRVSNSLRFPALHFLAVHFLTNQTIRCAARDVHLNVLSQKILARCRKIYDAVAGGSAGPLVARGVVGVHENFIRPTDKFFIPRDLNL